MGTPDWRQDEPFTGQRLVIRWVIPKRDFKYGDYQLQLKLRFFNNKQQTVLLTIENWQGTYVYNLLNEAFKDSSGIVSYQVNLIDSDVVIRTWNHPLWVELINFSACE